MTATVEPPADMLASHPETAYFWGRVVGDGALSANCVTVRASDETAAERLAAIAGADGVNRDIVEREYAHDTNLSRRKEEEFTVQVIGDLADRASAAFGLPLGDQPGGYRLDALADYDRHLLRGLLEGGGTVCYRASAGVVGVSFVHEDRRLLEAVQSMLDDLPVESSAEDISEASSGRYWFGLTDEAAPAVGEWLYEGADESGLFDPSRRRKLIRSLEQAGYK
ncbi:MAG: LAGLIDADG family homing endonuclease [Halolamina sp.]